MKRALLAFASVFCTHAIALKSQASVPEQPAEQPLAQITAQLPMQSPDINGPHHEEASHLIGYKDGAVTSAFNAQMEGCVAAFLDGEEAHLQAGETLTIRERHFQDLERDTCAEMDTLPNGQAYCKQFGPPEHLVGGIAKMRSNLTGREVQLFCLAHGKSPTAAEAMRARSLGQLFKP